MNHRSFARALVLCLVLTIVGPIVGPAVVPAWAQQSRDICCSYCLRPTGHDPSCPSYQGTTGSAPIDPGVGGDGGLVGELIVLPFMLGFGLLAGLWGGSRWLVSRALGDTSQGVFEFLDVTGEMDSGDVIYGGSMAVGGAILLVFYLPALGVSTLAGAAIDDDGEASSRVSTRAEELRVEAATAHDAFVSAHPPSSDTAVDATFFRAADDAATRRARRDEALAAANDVAAPVAAAPAPPVWPTTPTALADPTRRVVRPLAVDVPPAFLAPTPPDTLASRSRNVLDRTRALLGEGAAEARGRLLEDVKDRAMGLLPNGVERALRAHLAAIEGSETTLVGKVAEGFAPVMIFGSPEATHGFRREIAGEELDTAAKVADEASGDGLFGLVRRGFRAEGSK